MYFKQEMKVRKAASTGVPGQQCQANKGEGQNEVARKEKEDDWSK